MYHRDKPTSTLVIVDRENISLIVQDSHECGYMGHMSEEETKETTFRTSWWPIRKQNLSEYINTCTKCQKANKGHGKQYGKLQNIEETEQTWKIINMDWVTGLFPGGKNSFNACPLVVDRYRNIFSCLHLHKEDT
ncbi:hypothetical protein O181_064557 [Austropuccinia psidii MF-1]|uniref:Integrase zinc-binding domain-containing protein n=1 Tax=Austropuccinia psidii MF-1 TaxID=1389203 RepID=A0A9Q3ERS1_9BASI|nr:hypothetical protein [Austropuccinia psidii MF-1]